MEIKIFDTVHLALTAHGVANASDVAAEIVASLAVQRMIPVVREYGVRLLSADALGEPREAVLEADSAQEAMQLAAMLNAKDASVGARAFQRNSGPWYEMELVVPA